MKKKIPLLHVLMWGSVFPKDLFLKVIYTDSTHLQSTPLKCE